jgi:hypothetical protein
MINHERLKRAWSWVYRYQEENWRLKLQLADAQREIQRLRRQQPYDFESAYQDEASADVVRLQPTKEE